MTFTILRLPINTPFWNDKFIMKVRGAAKMIQFWYQYHVMYCWKPIDNIMSMLYEDMTEDLMIR